MKKFYGENTKIKSKRGQKDVRIEFRSIVLSDQIGGHGEISFRVLLDDAHHGFLPVGWHMTHVGGTLVIPFAACLDSSDAFEWQV
jgi:hypothetical protein